MTILEEVNKIFRGLKDFEIKIDSDIYINIVEDLKKTPRTGFAVRVDKGGVSIPKQSIYDHLLSLAHNSEVLQEDLGIEYDKE